MRDDRPTHERLGAAESAALAGVLLSAAAVVAWTWRTWPDVISDSGRELYVAWQLASGRVLYRDVSYFNGPLSPYVNAAWFAVAGPGLAVLEIVNGALAALVGALTWRFARRLAGPREAAACALLFVTVFATGPLTAIGSFSWLIPYSHELTHGILLLLLLLFVIERWLDRGERSSLAAAGLLAGACLLTKPEIAIAAAAILATTLVLAGRKAAWRSLALAASLAIAVPLAAWAMLASAMPPAVALEGILGSWAHLTDSRLVAMPYFRMFLGTDRPLANLGAMLSWSAAWLLVATSAVAAGRLARGRPRFGAVLGTLAVIVGTAAAIAARHIIPWLDVFRPLPLAALAVLAWTGAAAVRAADLAARRRSALTAAAAAGALALTLKMILFARAWHYGFALGMPAAMIAVGAMGALVRRATGAVGGASAAAAGVLAGVLAGTIAGHLGVMGAMVQARHVSVGSGRDAMLADERGTTFARALDEIRQRFPDDATLAVLPDGVMLSYLARRPNSTPYIIGNPADVEIFGEERMLAAYRAHPPDVLAVTRCDTTIYGYPLGFGRDYARALGAWLAGTYEPVITIDGGPPSSFGVAILRRRGYVSSRSSGTNDGSGANVSSR